ncbi:unnamed protein product [Hymenolepis diminuta]|uniref:Integrase zinc-binding domain-containing protein n=1 Tax=Hymenolepis diminuta TaxID=6216 RepID=A0A564YWD9_HYMDI|nr:unnamed protein product [Hymenolepis diminuta]
MYICSVINGAGLLSMDFLEKQQTRILLDKHKLVLNGTTELKLGRELPSLGSRMVNTQGTKSQKSSSREKILLTEIADTSEEVQAFLSNNEDIFALDGEPTGRSSIIKHTIDTGDAKPVALRPQRTPVQYQEFVSEEIANLLKNKIIRPSSSAWAAPIVVTKKKNGALRLCVDYPKLNAVTKRDQYPMPRIDDGNKGRGTILSIWWPNMREDVDAVCAECQLYERAKSPNHQPRAPLQPMRGDSPTKSSA